MLANQSETEIRLRQCTTQDQIIPALMRSKEDWSEDCWLPLFPAPPPVPLRNSSVIDRSSLRSFPGQHRRQDFQTQFLLPLARSRACQRRFSDRSTEPQAQALPAAPTNRRTKLKSSQLPVSAKAGVERDHSSKTICPLLGALA